MYIEFFGLRESPFNSTIDPKFFFASPQHEEALASLTYAVAERKGLVVTTGDVGAGKTTVTRMLVHQLGKRADAAIINASHLAETDLLENLCSQLQAPIDAGFKTMEILASLEEHLFLLASRDRLAVLIVDDAHALTEKYFEQLRLVSNLESAGGKLLQIVLAGQSDLNHLLQRPSSRQFQQRVFRSFHIARFTREQTERYIEFRLRTAGLPEANIFADEAITLIHQYSNGICRLINNLCDNLLLSAFSDGVRTVDRDRVNRVIDEVMSNCGPTSAELHAANNREDVDAALTDITSHYARSLETQVGELEATVADTDRRIHELHRLSAKLQAQELKLSEHEPAIDAKLRELHRLSASLQVQEEGLQRREESLTRQAEELGQLSERLEAQDKQVLQREAEMSQQFKEIQRLTAALAEQDERLAERTAFLDRKLADRHASFDRELNDCKRAITRKWQEIRDLVAKYEAKEDAQNKRVAAVFQRLEQFEKNTAQVAIRQSSLTGLLEESRRVQEELTELQKANLQDSEQSSANLRQLIEQTSLILDRPVEILNKTERQVAQVERMARIVQSAGEGLHKAVEESMECCKRLGQEGKDLCRRLEEAEDDARDTMKELEARAGKTHELREVLGQIFVRADGQVQQLSGVVVQAEQIMGKLPQQLEQLRQIATHPTQLVRELRTMGSATERNLHDGQVRLAELRMMIDKAEKARVSIEALILASRRVAESRRPVPVTGQAPGGTLTEVPRHTDPPHPHFEALTEAVRQARGRSTLDVPERP